MVSSSSLKIRDKGSNTGKTMTFQFFHSFILLHFNIHQASNFSNSKGCSLLPMGRTYIQLPQPLVPAYQVSPVASKLNLQSLFRTFALRTALDCPTALSLTLILAIDCLSKLKQLYIILKLKEL